ncbi:MAG: hypothetical protein ABIC95_05890 [archaeon]
MGDDTALGLTPYHYGLIAGNALFAPSQFALAWIGVTEREGIAKHLDDIVDDILEKETTSTYKDETPELYRLISQKEKGRFGIEDLEEMVFKEYKTKKMVRDSAAREPGRKAKQTKPTHYATMSDKTLVSMKITSRKKGQVERDYNPTFQFPFVQKAEDLTKFDFHRTAQQAYKNLAKGRLFFEGHTQEKIYLDMLKKTVDELHDGDNFVLQKKDVDNDHFRSLKVVDYTAAAGLTKLYQLVKNDQLHMIKTKGAASIDKSRDKVVCPFDFDKRPDLALEAFVRRYHRPDKDSSSDVDEHRGRLMSIDNFFIGKSGFYSPFFQELVRKHDVMKGTMMLHRNLPNYLRNIYMALDEHYYLREGKQTRFRGFGLEWPGKKHQVMSAIYSLDEKPADNSLSISVILSPRTKMPLILYRDFHPSYDIGWDHDPLEGDPLEMINLPSNMGYPKETDRKRWVEKDPRTGLDCVCTLVAPTAEILNRASYFSKLGHRKGVDGSFFVKQYHQHYPNRI